MQIVSVLIGWSASSFEILLIDLNRNEFRAYFVSPPRFISGGVLLPIDASGDIFGLDWTRLDSCGIQHGRSPFTLVVESTDASRLICG